jgi:hypothetical protein
MTVMATGHNPVDLLQEFGNRYSHVLVSHLSRERDLLLHATYPCLAGLLMAGAEISAMPLSPSRFEEPPADENGIGEWRRIHESLRKVLGPLNEYVVLEAWTKDAAQIPGSLALDLADIYQEVQQFRSLPQTRGDWLWNVKVSFELHWATHAVHALGAIHDLTRRGLI